MSFINTVNYSEKSYTDIFTYIMQKAKDLGLLSQNISITDVITNPQAYADYYLILYYSAFSYVMSQAWQDVTKVNDGLNMYTAPSNDPVQVGDALQILASPFIGDPYAPGYAITEVTLSRDTPATEDILIPLGARFQCNTDDTLVFATTKQDILLTGTDSVTIPVQCTTSGIKGNNAGADSLTIMVNPITGIKSVTNNHAATGGTPGESRASYLQRFSDWKYVNIHGTRDAILAAISGVSSVGSFYIEPKPIEDGEEKLGKTIVTIQPNTEQILNLVTAAINIFKAVDENVVVQGAESEEIDINAVANYTLTTLSTLSQSDMARLNELVVNYLTVYINGGLNRDGTVRKGSGIGQSFIISQAVRYVEEQIPELVDLVLYDLEENPLGNITISNNQVAVAGTITATNV